MAVAALPLSVGPGPVTAPRLTAFDVGQGDALLVEIPGDPPARLLYDGGPEAVLDHLRDAGWAASRRSWSATLTTTTSRGLPAVVENLPVGVLLVLSLAPAPTEARISIGVQGQEAAERSWHAAF